MDELEKGLAISLTGTEAETALEGFRRQITAWDIAMPNIEPLVLDFGLGHFMDTGLIEAWIANEAGAGYCGKYMFVFADQTCPMHQHQEKLETFFIVKGQVRMKYGKDSFVMNPGDTLKVETGIYHSFTAVNEPALLLELSKPCVIDDNYFEDTRIPIGGNYTG